ncbi:MAG: hypothetical protein Q4C09_01610, partial [Atopobiaceae bacterium]|nr:hypothetical protein [Atopobiaceae bacterium]
AVLVAISIPVFTTQLEKSRESVDLSNIRGVYAECAAAVLTAPSGTTGISKQIPDLKQTDKAKWIIDVSDVAGKDLSDSAHIPSNCKYVNVAADGTWDLTANKTDGYKTLNSDGTLS